MPPMLRADVQHPKLTRLGQYEISHSTGRSTRGRSEDRRARSATHVVREEQARMGSADRGTDGGTGVVRARRRGETRVIGRARDWGDVAEIGHWVEAAAAEVRKSWATRRTSGFEDTYGFALALALVLALGLALASATSGLCAIATGTIRLGESVGIARHRGLECHLTLSVDVVERGDRAVVENDSGGHFDGQEMFDA